MNITANGKSYDIEPGTTLPAFVESQGLAIGRVVVERNSEALTQSEAREAVLAEGDTLEIVRIVAGG